MARVIVSDLADADTARILGDIAREAGHLVAAKYNARIEKFYDMLADFPESRQARPKLGARTQSQVFAGRSGLTYVRENDRQSRGGGRAEGPGGGRA